MDRETIEANDQRLINHFRTIVAQNENKAPVKPSFRPVLWLGLVGLVAAFMGIGYVAWDSDVPPAETSQPLYVKPAPTDGQTPDAVVPEMAAKQETNALNPSVTEPRAVIHDTPQVEAPAPPLAITQLVTCSNVTNRQHDRVKSVFSLKDKIKPVVWMTVITETPPRTLTHVYYINGEKYCEVPLTIRFPRTRTWSHVTIDKNKHLGPWLVDVVDENGAVLDQVKFEVVP